MRCRAGLGKNERSKSDTAISDRETERQRDRHRERLLVILKVLSRAAASDQTISLAGASTCVGCVAGSYSSGSGSLDIGCVLGHRLGSGLRCLDSRLSSDSVLM